MTATDLLRRAVGRTARPRGRGRVPDLTSVTFLVVGIDGRSGVERTVLGLATELVATHRVRIVSLHRRRDTPHFPIDPRIQVVHLGDQRRGRPTSRLDRLDRLPSLFDPGAKVLTARTDLRLLRLLRRLEPGVLVTTRPALHAVVAAVAPPQLVTVAQDHLNFPVRMQRPRIPELMGTVVGAPGSGSRGVDALVTLTGADTVDYRAAYPGARAAITTIPNATPFPRAATAPPLDSRTIVSVGRLEHRKGMHRVIAAFAPLAAQHPDWRLEIWGAGVEHDKLTALVARHGLGDQVRLQGLTDDVVGVLDRAAVFAMGSLHEGFPMVLLEAFSRGVPVVAYDCPRGPSDIVRDGVNGRLVPDGDRAAYTAALDGLMRDADLRHAYGTQALADVAAYAPETIGRQWTALFADLAARRGRG